MPEHAAARSDARDLGITPKPKVLRRPANLSNMVAELHPETKKPRAIVRNENPSASAHSPLRAIAAKSPWYQDQQFTGFLVVAILLINVAFYFALGCPSTDVESDANTSMSIYDSSRMPLSTSER